MKQPARFSLFLVLIAVGLALGFYSWNRPRASADRFQMLATWGLGDHLGSQYARSQVLVFSNPFTRRPTTSPEILQQEANRLAGLEKGFRNRMQSITVVHPELRPEAETDPHSLVLDPLTTTPLSFLVTSNAFDDAIASRPDTDLVVSLVGLPLNWAEMDAWRRAVPLRFALLLPDLQILGGLDGLRKAFDSGRLVAIVLAKPASQADAASVKRLNRQEFDRHFVLVTEQNVAEIDYGLPTTTTR